MKTTHINPKTIPLPPPLCGIRFVILTDGTVYENHLYECSKRLTVEEYTAIFNHVTTLLCGNIPAAAGDGSMARPFGDAGK